MHAIRKLPVLLALLALGASSPKATRPTSKPMLFVDQGEVHFTWKRAGGPKGQLTLTAELDQPKLRVVETAPASPPPEPPPKQPPPSTGALAKRVSPLPLDVPRLEITGGELLYLDRTADPHIRIWVHDLAVAVDNFSTREADSGGRPAMFSLHGRVGDSGRLTAFVTADPWAPGLTFAGRAQLLGLKTSELYDLLAAKTGLQAPKGTLDLFVEFVVKDGKITGSVKPVLDNVEVRSDTSGLLKTLEARALDTAVDLLSDQGPGEGAVATVVPIHGRIRSPGIGIFRSILGVLRNAFVAAIEVGFENMSPSPTSQASPPPPQGTLAAAGSPSPSAGAVPSGAREATR